MIFTWSRDLINEWAHRYSNCRYYYRAENWYFAEIGPRRKNPLYGIDFYLMPFYSSRASDPDGIWKNHVRQNGYREQELHSLDFTTMHTLRSSLCIKSVLVYIKTYFMPKERLFFLCIIKAYRIRHVSSHHAFFITCSINVKNIMWIKGLMGFEVFVCVNKSRRASFICELLASFIV